MTRPVDLLVHDAQEVYASVFEAIRSEISAGREPQAIGIGIAAAIHEIRSHCPACRHIVDYALISYYDPPAGSDYPAPPPPTEEAYTALYGARRRT